MSSDTVQTNEILTGPENFPLWKVKVIHKLRSSKVYRVITTADPLPIVRTAGAVASDLQDWIARDEKAHGITQECLSDTLLLKTESCTSAMALWEELKKLLDASNVSSAFYIFQQLFHATWDGSTRTVSEHIALLQTLEACLAAMKFTVDVKVMAFIPFQRLQSGNCSRELLSTPQRIPR